MSFPLVFSFDGYLVCFCWFFVERVAVAFLFQTALDSRVFKCGFLEKSLTSARNQFNMQVCRFRRKPLSLLSHDNFWNAIITFPTTKKMLTLSLKKCPECGRTVLEAALDDYVGKTTTKCTECSGFYSRVIRFWIECLRRSLNIK